MSLPDYKKRTNIALVIFREWNNNNLADVEFDSMMKALYSDVSVKQQDRKRLAEFIIKFIPDDGE